MDKVLNALPGSLGAQLAKLLTRNDATANSGRSALLAFAIRVASAGIIFVSQIILARWMGTFEYGIYTYIWVWLCVIAVLAPLGTSTAVVRFIPEYIEHGKHAAALGFLRFGRYLSLGIGILCLVAGLATLATDSAFIPAHYRTPMLFGLLCLPGFALIEFMDGTGRSRGWMDLALAPGYIMRPLLVLVFITFAALLGHDRTAETAVIALAIATWATAATQFFLQRHRLNAEITPAPRVYDLRLWLAVALPAMLLDSFALFMMNFDILVLELFVEPDQIAIYFAAVRTISLVAFVHFAVTAAFMSRFSTAYANRDFIGIRHMLHQARMWTLIPSLAGACFLLAAGKPLLWLFGPEFTDGYPVMFILAAGILARAAAGPAQGLLVVTGQQNITAVVLCASVVLNCTLNLALIPYYGLLGAATATAAAFALESLILFIIAKRFTRRQAHPSASEVANGTHAE